MTSSILIGCANPKSNLPMRASASSDLQGFVDLQLASSTSHIILTSEIVSIKTIGVVNLKRKNYWPGQFRIVMESFGNRRYNMWRKLITKRPAVSTRNEEATYSKRMLSHIHPRWDAFSIVCAFLKRLPTRIEQSKDLWRQMHWIENGEFGSIR